MNGDTSNGYCCEAQTALSMAGTADRVDVWLLLEYRGTWTPRVIDEATFDAPVRDWLQDVSAGFAARGLRLRPHQRCGNTVVSR